MYPEQDVNGIENLIDQNFTHKISIIGFDKIPLRTLSLKIKKSRISTWNLSEI